MPEALQNFINGYGTYIGIGLGILIFLAMISLRNKLSDGILRLVSKILFAKAPEKRESFINSLKKPLSGYCVVLGAYIGIIINYTNSAITAAFKIISILFVCRFLISFVSDNLETILSAKNSSPEHNNIAVKFITVILKVLTVFIAIVMVISELGYNISGLLTSLGVGGLAISLGAQDTIKSIISGFVIMFDRPFDVGDFIETADFSGTVEDITLRSTRIRKTDDTVIIVPNTTISEDIITNYAKLHKRLIDTEIGLLYSTSEETLRKCIDDIKAFLKGHKKVEKDSIRVRFTEFGDSALKIQIRCYIRVTESEKYYAFTEEMNFAVKNIVEKNGTDFAFPTNSVYIEGAVCGGKKDS